MARIFGDILVVVGGDVVIFVELTMVWELSLKLKLLIGFDSNVLVMSLLIMMMMRRKRNEVERKADYIHDSGLIAPSIPHDDDRCDLSGNTQNTSLAHEHACHNDHEFG